MRRRYSCQSWNVAAKVVIYPDCSEEEFVTARESINKNITEEDSEEDTETLETCFEDIKDITEKDDDSVSETLGRSSKYRCLLYPLNDKQ